MFFKLCKHELKCSYRNFLLLYVVLLIVSILFDPYQEQGFFSSFIAFLYAIIIIVLLVMCIVVIIRNYNNSMFSRNSYLTHSLPVSTTQLLLTKIFSAGFWLFMSFIVFMLSVFIIIFRGFGFLIITSVFHFIATEGFAGVGILAIVYGFFSIIQFISLVYLVMNMTHTTHITKYRSGLAFLFYIIISWAVSYITALIVANSSVSKGIMMKLKDITPMGIVENPSIAFGEALGILIVISIVFTMIYFFVSKYILDHKLEIE